LLHKAVRYNRTWCIKTLLNNGCSLNLENSDGSTCLELAVFKDSVDVIKELFRYGVIKPGELEKLKDLAGRLNRTEVLEILRLKGEEEKKMNTIDLS